MGAESTQERAPTAAFPPPRVSLENVHLLSTYELRQEVDRRGILEDVGPSVHYDTLLQAVVRALMKEKREVEKTVACSVPQDSEEEPLADKLKRERERRKQEALERSRARQADKGYFASKQAANKLPAKAEEALDASSPGEEEEEDTPAVSSLNPKGYKIYMR